MSAQKDKNPTCYVQYHSVWERLNWIQGHGSPTTELPHKVTRHSRTSLHCLNEERGQKSHLLIKVKFISSVNYPLHWIFHNTNNPVGNSTEWIPVNFRNLLQKSAFLYKLTEILGAQNNIKLLITISVLHTAAECYCTGISHGFDSECITLF